MAPVNGLSDLREVRVLRVQTQVLNSWSVSGNYQKDLLAWDCEVSKWKSNGTILPVLCVSLIYNSPIRTYALNIFKIAASNVILYRGR